MGQPIYGPDGKVAGEYDPATNTSTMYAAPGARPAIVTKYADHSARRSVDATAIVDEGRAAIAAQLLSRIEGVLATKESKYIMLNAEEEALESSTFYPGAGICPPPIRSIKPSRSPS